MSNVFIFRNLFFVFAWFASYQWSIAQPIDDPAGVRIAWDYSSLQQLAIQGGYPRLIRLQDASLMAVFETRTGNIQLINSKDNGITWSKPVDVFSQFSYSNLDGTSTLVNAANPEIKQLHNGTILLACNYRPKEAEIAPYAIVVRRSNDNGLSWTSPETIYTAAPRFTDGCWEPSFLQLPNGDVHVYFANESPYRHSDEQEISLLRSFDNGISWEKEATTVSFRQNRRDGMPVATLLNGEILLAIEDNKIGQFKPYIVRSSIDDNWKEPILAESINRQYALKKAVPDTVYMGAPYLLTLPNGQVLLSYQTNRARAKDWELSTMEVAIGDKNGEFFDHITQPFTVPLNKEAKWNSLALWNEDTVVALTSSNFKSKRIAPWLIKGYLLPNQLKLHKAIETHPLFVGASSENNLNATLKWDGRDLSISCMIKSDHTENNKGFLGLNLFLKLDNEVLKIWSGKNEDTKFYRSDEDMWTMISPLFDSRIEKSQSGYKVTYKIPSSKLKKRLKLGFSVLSLDENNRENLEYLTGMDEKITATWLDVEL